ncbi:hypothetical protein KVU_PB0207 (plasmid) [Ketogulonicigenium vulgare WSH-001]|uniref:Uncharacterized protein n=1 Tax=Ketogulonicigenium vulgare (strain WSH-001) TaxID=759362 RepID=F9YBY3_KETVW|nr:hypothetical protein KVU_PB0207 [Ketogulonicigenium vulgare WSH-001]
MLVLAYHLRVALALRDHHCGDLARQPPIALRPRRICLRAQRHCILIGAGNTEIIRHILAGLRHAIDAIRLFHRRVHKPPANGGVMDFSGARKGGFGLWHHERRARHALHAARDHQIGLARRNGARRGNDRIHARSAQAIDRRPRDLNRQPRQQQRHPRHIAVILARLIGTAKDHIIDRRPIDTGVARHQRPQRHRAQVIGPHHRQRTAKTPDRRTDVVANINVTHGSNLWHNQIGNFAHDMQSRAGHRLQFIKRHPRQLLAQHEPPALDINHRKRGINPRHAPYPGQRQRAAFQQFRPPVLGHVIGDHRDAFGAMYQIHRAADRWHTLWPGRPIRQIAIFRDLISPQNRHIQMPAAHHRETIGMMEKRSTRVQRHRTLARIDQIPILGPRCRAFAKIQDAILGMENRLTARRLELRHLFGESDAKVHIRPVFDILRRAPRDLVVRQLHLRPPADRRHSPGSSLLPAQGSRPAPRAARKCRA